MTAYYSKRKKASLAHKFASHIKPQPDEIRVFINWSHVAGYCRHVPSRYVFNRKRSATL